MVLDFGSFTLDSDVSAAADLPAEEAALYMGFRLSARNISSFLVDGDFSWALLKSLEAPKSKQSSASYIDTLPTQHAIPVPEERDLITYAA